MKRPRYSKTQIAIWVISLLVVISMLCSLVASLVSGAGNTSMSALPNLSASLLPPL